ncbi:hypothetical protein UFOVP1462_4 [uncultured Caudovirales phage]|uniref:Uncharacterized protein n=1 Tax=uncultured Caudovirales phage TaxID=2100421 RepID=A0A6J5SHS3_9CAUD|nr:hypothetical protein UFOVP1013_4 [uncultured Caudovirales phage]CAB4202566.1 hypothetical protein UFOVP1364_21 [uncultured Caudovirales phage]CAB4213929.1 hypothetical protein UFOVP1462_4 [uncultured Caudovirales phage]CAB5228600.1 hypothetical protein UFOVP1550_13 [uncultured Caudovirales phage]
MPDKPLIEIAQELRDIAKWLKDLSTELTPGRTGERSSRSVAGPRLPVRVDVLDAILGVRNDTLAWEIELRLKRNQEAAPNSDVERSIYWVADTIEKWPTDNRTALIEEIGYSTATRHTQIKILLGLEQRPLTARLRCPHCDKNLVIKLDRGLLLCRNHHCRCVVDECECAKGRGHAWGESDWPRLGLMLDTPREV